VDLHPQIHCTNRVGVHVLVFTFLAVLFGVSYCIGKQCLLSIKKVLGSTFYVARIQLQISRKLGPLNGFKDGNRR